MDIRDVLPSICLREYLTERKKKKKKKKRISVLDILLNYYFVLYERISLPSIEMEDFSVWVSKAPFRKRRRSDMLHGLLTSVSRLILLTSFYHLYLCMLCRSQLLAHITLLLNIPGLPDIFKS